MEGAIISFVKTRKSLEADFVRKKFVNCPDEAARK
jgi:hypothetical protein